MSPAAEAESRLDYARAMGKLLWPAMGSRVDAPQMVLLPSPHMPRLLVPVRPRRAAAAATIRYSAQQDLRFRIGSLAIAGAVRAGLCSALAPKRSGATVIGDAESIDDHLSEVLGVPTVSSLPLTPARNNRKPVLQVFDRSGRTLAFAKIGINPLTCSLVDGEAAVLRRLGEAGLHHIQVPQILHHGRWKHSAVLVTTALAVGMPVRASSHALDDAMYEISCSSTGQVDYLAATRNAAVAAGERLDRERIGRWLEVFDEAVEAHQTEGLPLGAWHGDWTTWNCSARRGRLGVWDWERCAVGVPHGFDKLHFVFNGTVGHGRDRFLGASRALVAEAPTLLSAWQLTPFQARATAVLYMLELSLRYLLDGARPSSAGSRIEDWAYPTIRSTLTPTKKENE